MPLHQACPAIRKVLPAGQWGPRMGRLVERAVLPLGASLLMNIHLIRSDSPLPPVCLSLQPALSRGLSLACVHAHRRTHKHTLSPLTHLRGFLWLLEERQNLSPWHLRPCRSTPVCYPSLPPLRSLWPSFWSSSSPCFPPSQGLCTCSSLYVECPPPIPL